ncbi:hypothetical protein MMC17_000844 [Xylographa soralifera]|nr:hypothetical protein [Xylographa soralifera]
MAGSEPRTSLAEEALRTDDGTLPGLAPSESPVMDTFHLQTSGGDDFPSLDLTMQEYLLDELVTFDGLLGLEDHSSAQHQVFADVSVVPCDGSGQQPRSWCTWMQPEAALSIMTENPMMRQDANSMQVLQVERPHAQHSADLIIQALRTLPMMIYGGRLFLGLSIPTRTSFRRHRKLHCLKHCQPV